MLITTDRGVRTKPLERRAYLDGVSAYQTNQVGNAFTVGTSPDTSDAFVGDWSQLYMGVRTQLQIQVLTERYADYGQIGFLAWWRGDVQVARPAAFDITTGVRP
jgi:HK97 family phage major capsid protein